MKVRSGCGGMTLAVGTALILAAACGSVQSNNGHDAGAGSDGGGDVPLVIAAATGDGQSGTPGTALAQPFVVEVTQGGQPVPGATVKFDVTAGGGTMSAAMMTTDAQGHAGSTLTLGSAPGMNTVQAQLSGTDVAPVVFNATCQPATAKKLTLVSGDRQSVRFGVQTSPLVVMVQDDAGNPVAGYTVAFNVTAGGGSMAVASAMSDGGGLAQARWIVGGPTTNTAEARGDGLVGSPVVFSANVSAFGAEQRFTNGSSTTSVVVGELNADGRPDLVLASQDTSGAPSTIVMRNATAVNSTTINLTRATTLTPPSTPSVVVVGDVNGDGKPDLVTVAALNTMTGVFLNTTPSGATTPTFAARVDVAFGGSFVLAMADFNGDGKPDLVECLLNGTDTFSVVLNTTAAGAATPSFGGRIDFSACGLAGPPTSITADDINGDGKPDVIIACSDPATPQRGAVSVFLNTTTSVAGPTSFAAAQRFGTALNLVSIATADLDHDGKPDIVGANKMAAAASVLINTTAPGATTPSFAASVDVPSGLAPVAVIAGDLNGDGKPDIATANRTSQSLSVMANLTDTSAGALRFASKLDLPLSVVPTWLTAADLNGDHKPELIAVGSTDILVFTGQ